MIVVDASVLVSALADDGPDGDTARRVLRGKSLVAPEIVDLEVLSVVRKRHADGALDARRALFALRDLEELPMERVPHRPLLDRCWELRDTLTPYDASYVAVAEMVEAPLVTADARVARAPGVACSVELVR